MNQFIPPNNSILDTQNIPILYSIIMRKHCKIETSVIMNYLFSIINTEETQLLIKNVLRIVNHLVSKNYSNSNIVLNFFLDFIHNKKIRDCLYDFECTNFLEVRENSYIFLLLSYLDLSSHYYQRNLNKLYNFLI